MKLVLNFLMVGLMMVGLVYGGCNGWFRLSETSYFALALGKCNVGENSDGMSYATKYDCAGTKLYQYIYNDQDTCTGTPAVSNDYSLWFSDSRYSCGTCDNYVDVRVSNYDNADCNGDVKNWSTTAFTNNLCISDSGKSGKWVADCDGVVESVYGTEDCTGDVMYTNTTENDKCDSASKSKILCNDAHIPSVAVFGAVLLLVFSVGLAV